MKDALFPSHVSARDGEIIFYAKLIKTFAPTKQPTCHSNFGDVPNEVSCYAKK